MLNAVIARQFMLFFCLYVYLLVVVLGRVLSTQCRFQLFPVHTLKMAKNPKFWIIARFGLFDDKDSGLFLLGFGSFPSLMYTLCT